MWCVYVHGFAVARIINPSRSPEMFGIDDLKCYYNRNARITEEVIES